MKKTLFILSIIGFVILGTICFYLKTQIDTAKNDILNLTATVNLQDEKINQTESQLVTTEQRLKETKSELSVAVNERDKALELKEEAETKKEEAETKLVDTERQLAYVERNLQEQKATTSKLQTEIKTIQTEIETIREELQLYHDTGIQVAQGIDPPYWTSPISPPFNLENNSVASNISWSQLKAFLKEDRTDNNPYLEDIYMCGDYAEQLHNNAESRGIKAAFVAIQFEDDSAAHALNAFMTADRGLVYIDVTGSPPGTASPNHEDCIVTIRVGQRLYHTLLFAPDWEPYNKGPRVSQVEIYW